MIGKVRSNRRASPQARDFVAFFAQPPIRAAQKGRQELPVRQTLPPGRSPPNGVKTQSNQGKFAVIRWHGACDSLFGHKGFVS
jgi:hypothetical protein